MWGTSVGGWKAPGAPLSKGHLWGTQAHWPGTSSAEASSHPPAAWPCVAGAACPADDLGASGWACWRSTRSLTSRNKYPTAPSAHSPAGQQWRSRLPTGSSANHKAPGCSTMIPWGWVLQPHLPGGLCHKYDTNAWHEAMGDPAEVLGAPALTKPTGAAAPPRPRALHLPHSGSWAVCHPVPRGGPIPNRVVASVSADQHREISETDSHRPSQPDLHACLKF